MSVHRPEAHRPGPGRHRPLRAGAAPGRVAEILLAAFAAVVAVNVFRRWWAYLESAAYGPPDELGGHGPIAQIYLVELAFLGVLGLLTICLDRDSAAESWGRITWFIAGMLSTLSFLGSWSIGSSVLPAALALLVAALLAGARRGRGKVEQAAHFVLGAIMQGVVTFLGTLAQNPGF